MLFQNPKSDNDVNFICSEISDEMLIFCSSSTILEFDNGFSVNWSLIELYRLIYTEKYFIKWLLRVIRWSEIVVIELMVVIQNQYAQENVLKMENKWFLSFSSVGYFCHKSIILIKATTLSYNYRIPVSLLCKDVLSNLIFFKISYKYANLITKSLSINLE